MENQKSEIRCLDIAQAELRADPNTGKISGYAIVFNSLSNLLFGRFYERILPEAMEGVITASDVLALLDHQRSRGVLGRSMYGKGTLSLTTDIKGVRYEFDPPKTALGEETKEYLRRGDIQGSSFDFRLADKGDKWGKSSDGKYIRTITKFSELKDISLVFTPAYPETTAGLRSLDAFIQEQNPKLKLSLEELNKYYQELDDKMKIFKQ